MFKVMTAAEQVAAHLKAELLKGHWTGAMPGRERLAKELGVDGSTIERALGEMEREGLLRSQGAGKRRLICVERPNLCSKRILIVHYDPDDIHGAHPIGELRSQLHAEGHTTAFAPRSLTELKHDPERVEAMIKSQPAEAFIVVAGTRPTLERLSRLSMPVFALFGPISNLPIAGTGPDKIPAIRDAIDCLHGNGHRRIVMLTQSVALQGGLNKSQIAFLEELKRRDLSSGSYNLPEWDSTPDGLQRCLASLFRLTPPTAILIDDWMLHYAIQNFLIRRRGTAYRRVACISTDYHPCFKWCKPGISYIYWDPLAVVSRVVRWVNNVAKGKDDRSHSPVRAKFVAGEGLKL